MVMPISSYGMNSYGMGSYGMGNFGMGGTSGNVYQEVKNKYGCGHIDFGHYPKFAGYPVEINPPPRPKYFTQTWFGRLLRRFSE